MFLAVELYDTTEGIIHGEINVAKIVGVWPRNPRNIDEGIIIDMQNGDHLLSPEPLYQFGLRRDECMNRFSVMILIAHAMECAKLIKKPVRKRTTVKKKV